MKKISWIITLVAVFWIGRMSSNGIKADVTTENTGYSQATLEATFVKYEGSHVKTTLTSDSGDWYFDSEGALHVPYLVIDPRSETDLPQPIEAGTFYFLKDPIRIAAVDAGGTLRTSEMICEDDVYLYSDLVLDEAYRFEGKWYYGDSIDS